jgi:D-tyrosyl-tRNA(Tyr) deacylase
MKAVIQRVKEASIVIDQQIYCSIKNGLLVFVCLENNDDYGQIEIFSQKIVKLRIFDDKNGKINHSIKDIQGEILLVSQFTLSWNGEGGNRPYFGKSMTAHKAKLMFHQVYLQVSKIHHQTKCSPFGADMDIELINNGPMTIIMNH